MKDKSRLLIDRLAAERRLSLSEYELLVRETDPDVREYARKLALAAREATYGRRVFVRALVEISNVCLRDCYYCGIRKSNRTVCRYALSPEQILQTCRRGHALGFRTFVLQGGENERYPDELLTDLISEIKRDCPDSAVTLSLGERSRESFARLKEAGADRYLLRHETANSAHFALLHPKEQSADARKVALFDLKSLGYQVGAGFLIGSPYQSARTLAEDLKFIEALRPQMCGIGPFLPQKDTPFAAWPAGDSALCLYLLSLLRLMDPALLLPSTTALATAKNDAHRTALEHGANVIMPNLTPEAERAHYTLYDNKRYTGAESAEQVKRLAEHLATFGYTIDFSRGDYAGHNAKENRL